LFDAYKMGKISLSLEYLSNMASVNGAGLLPTSYMYWDQDDIVTPVNLTDVVRRSGVKVRTFGNKAKNVHSISFIPVPSVATQSIATSTAVTPAIIPEKRCWIDCVDLNVPHFALKVFLTDVYLPGGAGANQCFRFNWTYNIAFRSPIDAY